MRGIAIPFGPCIGRVRVFELFPVILAIAVTWVSLSSAYHTLVSAIEQDWDVCDSLSPLVHAGKTCACAETLSS